jgi:steroid 5-alpha reductase family enzyme
MSFLDIYFRGLPLTVGMMSLLWLVSVFKKNAGIADIFWGTGFILLNGYYFLVTRGIAFRKMILFALVCAWGLRLFLYILRRNWGNGEDFRYKEFRQKYGSKRYWWVSFFQVFLLQGVLLWLISAPLLGAQFYASQPRLGIWDILGILFWLIGFLFEAGGDFQLARFKKNPQNHGKVLDRGFWKYTRHPNYFGDSCVWWGYGLLSIAGGCIFAIYGSLLMTLLIIRVSGVMLLEKTLKQSKPGYREYAARTSAFFPWFPRQKK